MINCGKDGRRNREGCSVHNIQCTEQEPPKKVPVQDLHTQGPTNKRTYKHKGSIQRVQHTNRY